MESMTQLEMIGFMRIYSDGGKSSSGVEMSCVRSAANSGKWVLVLSVNGKPIKLKSNREDVRTFATLEAAHKVSSSIVNSMTIIGQ